MARTFRHWSPTYVRDRVLVQINLWRNANDPWLTKEAIGLLCRLLRPEDAGFEWGSGRSTVWFAARTGHLTSVEGNKVWHERVGTRLRGAGITNVDYQFHPIDGLDEARAADAPYVQAVGKLADVSLDYALIDGWARDFCALRVLPKLKPGAMIILDNANWYLTPPADFARAPKTRKPNEGPVNTNWKDFADSVSAWRRVWTTDGVTSTLILFKP